MKLTRWFRCSRLELWAICFGFMVILLSLVLLFSSLQAFFYEKETLRCSKTFSIAADRHHKAGVATKMECFTGKIQTELQDYGNTDTGHLLLKYLNVCFHIFMTVQSYGILWFNGLKSFRFGHYKRHRRCFPVENNWRCSGRINHYMLLISSGLFLDD